MKARWIIVAAVILVLICVAHGLTTDASVTGPPSTEPALQQEVAPAELAKKKGCLRCHSVDKQVIGPAFQDVAKRYKENDQARDALINTVKNGGKGNWTEITGGTPMPPHSGRLSTSDIERLVDWVLSLQAGN